MPTLLRYQELLLKRPITQLEAEKSMYDSYIDMLDFSGLLSMPPLRHYLQIGYPLVQNAEN